ncbi:MAG: hypothetical protein ABEJ73_07535 [Haloplanus sp.]
MMKESAGADCPLCPRRFTDHPELRLHLMVEHRKSTVIDEYVDRLDQQAALAP